MIENMLSEMPDGQFIIYMIGMFIFIYIIWKIEWDEPNKRDE